MAHASVQSALVAPARLHRARERDAMDGHNACSMYACMVIVLLGPYIILLAASLVSKPGGPSLDSQPGHGHTSNPGKTCLRGPQAADRGLLSRAVPSHPAAVVGEDGQTGDGGSPPHKLRAMTEVREAISACVRGKRVSQYVSYTHAGSCASHLQQQENDVHGTHPELSVASLVYRCCLFWIYIVIESAADHQSSLNPSSRRIDRCTGTYGLLLYK